MNRAEGTTHRTVLVAIMVLVVQAVGLGAEPYAELDGTAHAKGIVVLKVFSPAHGTFTGISLSLSRDGETFEPAGAGFPRPAELFSSVAQSGRGTGVCVPIVGRAGYMEYEAFLFEEPGTYYLRWSVGLKDGDSLGFKVYQTIAVAPPSAADLQMLAALSDWEFLSRLSVTESFKNIPDDAREFVKSPEGADFRALKVIGKLLKATRAREPGSIVKHAGGIENGLKWADALWKLAEEYPESSYAPYAAYYGGCCYLAGLFDAIESTMKERGLKDRRLSENEVKKVASLVREHPHYAKADQMLRMAEKHADSYLKPRAMYMQAYLLGGTATWDEAERLLDEAVAEAGGEGTISELVIPMRRGLDRSREKHGSHENAED